MAWRIMSSNVSLLVYIYFFDWVDYHEVIFYIIFFEINIVNASIAWIRASLTKKHISREYIKKAFLYYLFI